MAVTSRVDPAIMYCRECLTHFARGGRCRCEDGGGDYWREWKGAQKVDETGRAVAGANIGDQVIDGGAMRHNKGKPQFSLIVGARAAIAGAARVLEFGANKYARDNWKKPTNLEVPADCLLRHLSAYLDGEYLDPESGLPHLDHVTCNAIFLGYHTDREGQDGMKK